MSINVITELNNKFLQNSIIQLEFNIPLCIKFNKFHKIKPKKTSYQPIEQGSLFSLKGDKE